MPFTQTIATIILINLYIFTDNNCDRIFCLSCISNNSVQKFAHFEILLQAVSKDSFISVHVLSVEHKKMDLHKEKNIFYTFKYDDNMNVIFKKCL